MKQANLLAGIMGAQLKKTDKKLPAGVKEDDGMTGLLAQLKEKRTLRKVPVDERKDLEVDTNPLQAELKNKMRLRKVSDRPVVFNKTSKGAVLRRDFGKAEVRRWLLSKNFSTMGVEKLSRFTGADLFDMSKDDFKSVCGFGEGIRVFSEVEKEKEVSEPKSELQAVLKHRQEEMETRDAAASATPTPEQAEPQKPPSEDEEDASKPAWLKNLQKAKKKKKDEEDRAALEAAEEERTRLEAEALAAEETAKAKTAEEKPEEVEEKEEEEDREDKEDGEEEEEGRKREKSDSSSDEGPKRRKKKGKGKSKGDEKEEKGKKKGRGRVKKKSASSADASASSQGSASLSTSSGDERSAWKRNKQRKKATHRYPGLDYQAHLPQFMDMGTAQPQSFGPYGQTSVLPHGYSQQHHPRYPGAPAQQSLYPPTAQFGPGLQAVGPQTGHGQYGHGAQGPFPSSGNPYPADFGMPPYRHHSPYPTADPLGRPPPSSLPYPTGNAVFQHPYPTDTRPMNTETSHMRRDSYGQSSVQFSAATSNHLPPPGPPASRGMQPVSLETAHRPGETVNQTRKESQGELSIHGPLSVPAATVPSASTVEPPEFSLPFGGMDVNEYRRPSVPEGQPLESVLTSVSFEGSFPNERVTASKVGPLSQTSQTSLTESLLTSQAPSSSQSIRTGIERERKVSFAQALPASGSTSLPPSTVINFGMLQSPPAFRQLEPRSELAFVTPTYPQPIPASVAQSQPLPTLSHSAGLTAKSPFAAYQPLTRIPSALPQFGAGEVSRLPQMDTFPSQPQTYSLQVPPAGAGTQFSVPVEFQGTMMPPPPALSPPPLPPPQALPDYQAGHQETVSVQHEQREPAQQGKLTEPSQ